MNDRRRHKVPVLIGRLVKKHLTCEKGCQRNPPSQLCPGPNRNISEQEPDPVGVLLVARTYKHSTELPTVLPDADLSVGKGPHPCSSERVRERTSPQQAKPGYLQAPSRNMLKTCDRKHPAFIAIGDHRPSRWRPSVSRVTPSSLPPSSAGIFEGKRGLSPETAKQAEAAVEVIEVSGATVLRPVIPAVHYSLALVAFLA